MPICKDCGADKPIEQFYTDMSRGTQRSWWCRSCMTPARKQRRKRAKVRALRAFEADWYHDHPEARTS